MDTDRDIFGYVQQNDFGMPLNTIFPMNSAAVPGTSPHRHVHQEAWSQSTVQAPFSDVKITKEVVFLHPLSDPLGLTLTPLCWRRSSGELFFLGTGSTSENPIILSVHAHNDTGIGKPNLAKSLNNIEIKRVRLVYYPSVSSTQIFEAPDTNIAALIVTEISGVDTTAATIAGSNHFLTFDPRAGQDSPLRVRTRRIQSDFVVCPTIEALTSRHACTVLGMRTTIQNVLVDASRIYHYPTSTVQILQQLDECLALVSEDYLLGRWRHLNWQRIADLTIGSEVHIHLQKCITPLLYRFWEFCAPLMLKICMLEDKTNAIENINKLIVARFAGVENALCVHSPFRLFLQRPEIRSSSRELSNFYRSLMRGVGSTLDIYRLMQNRIIRSNFTEFVAETNTRAHELYTMPVASSMKNIALSRKRVCRALLLVTKSQ